MTSSNHSSQLEDFTYTLQSRDARRRADESGIIATPSGVMLRPEQKFSPANQITTNPWLRIVVEEGNETTLISLTRRKQLARVFSVLVGNHLSFEGALSAQDIFSVAWKGEAAAAKSAANRVRVALTTLRSLGLRKAIETSERGYRLSENAIVSIRGEVLHIRL